MPAYQTDGVAMSFLRCVLIVFALLLSVVPVGSYAAKRSQGMVTKTEKSLRGTWYSAEGTITFRVNGTVKIRGKRYFYAVSNGGMIELSGNHSSNAIPYQLAGDKLTLTINGHTAVYSRKRPRK
jgi:hypothetical protein